MSIYYKVPHHWSLDAGLSIPDTTKSLANALGWYGETYHAGSNPAYQQYLKRIKT